MLVFSAGIHAMLVRIAKREDSDQTASSEAVCSGFALFYYAFLASTCCSIILEHLDICSQSLTCMNKYQ